MSNSGKKAYLVAITETSTFARWFSASSKQDAIERASNLFNSIGADDFQRTQSTTEAIDILIVRDIADGEVCS